MKKKQEHKPSMAEIMRRFCPRCHMMFTRTKDGEWKCRRCEPKYFAEPEKKRGVDLRW